MKTFEQFCADESENIRSGLVGMLEVCIPNQLADARRVRVRVDSGGRVLRMSGGSYSKEAELQRLSDILRAELADMDSTLRKHYRTEVWLKERGHVSLV